MTPFQILLLLGVCISWAFHLIVIKTTVDLVPPLTYVAFRMPILALLLSPLLRWHPGQMHRVFMGGLCFAGLNYLFMFSGFRLTTASVGAVVLESYVVVATILSVVFLKETVGWKRGSGIAAARSGVLIIATGDSEATGSRNLPLGATLIFLAACCEATGAIFVKKIGGIKPLAMLAWFTVVGTFVTVPAALVFDTDHFAWTSSPDLPQILAAMFYSVFVASLIAHPTYYYLLQRVPLSVIAPSGLLITFFAVIMGVLLLGEPVTLRLLMGAGLVVAGVGVVLVRSNPPERRQVATSASFKGDET